MSNSLNVYRPRKPTHPLHVRKTIKVGKVYQDPKTLVEMIPIDQPFKKKGAGVTRGIGVKVCHKQPAREIIAISKEPIAKMDLINYTKEDYKKNGWYVHGENAFPPNEFTQLFNTRAPLDGQGNIEQFNAKIEYGQLPESKGLRKKHPPGIYCYIRTSRVIRSLEFVILDNYGKGAQCLRWGQEPILKRQAENMARFEMIESTKSKQVGNVTCRLCAYSIPRGKINEHNFICSENRVTV